MGQKHETPEAGISGVYLKSGPSQVAYRAMDATGETIVASIPAGCKRIVASARETMLWVPDSYPPLRRLNQTLSTDN